MGPSFGSKLRSSPEFSKFGVPIFGCPFQFQQNYSLICEEEFSSQWARADCESLFLVLFPRFCLCIGNDDGVSRG